MVRKRMIISSIIISSACLFSACSHKKTDEPDIQTTKQSQVTAFDITNSDAEVNSQTTKQSQAAVSRAAGDQINSDTENGVENLTKNTIQGASVGIDYEINSYEDVQKFGYELFGQNIREKILSFHQRQHIWRFPWQAVGRPVRQATSFTMYSGIWTCLLTTW